MANKTSISAVGDDQTGFIFDLMKEYNVSSFFKKKVKLKI